MPEVEKLTLRTSWLMDASGNVVKERVVASVILYIAISSSPLIMEPENAGAKYSNDKRTTEIVFSCFKGFVICLQIS